MKVLYIAYFFPPLGGGGVQRTTKFVKYLPENGFEPTVLTVTEDNPYKHDESLSSEIPPSTTVIRVQAPGFEWLNRIGRKLHITPLTAFITSFFSIPDPFIGWYRPALQAARKVLREQDIPVLITTSSPFTSHLIGRKLKKEFPHLIWIADFRDQWSTNRWIHYPTPLHKWINTLLDHRVVRECTALVAINKPMLQELIEGAQCPPEKGFAISNGYDSADFVGFTRTEPEKFTITYAGTVYGELNPSYFFAATRIAVQRQPDIVRSLRLVFVGAGTTDIRRVFGLKEEWWQEILDIRGYVPHKESLRSLGSSSALLLIVPSSFGSSATSGKIFEYLASGTPIFGLVASGTEAERILTTTNTATIVDPEDPERIAEELEKLFHIWQNAGRLPYEANKEEIRRYDRRVLTKELARVIRALTDNKNER